MNDSSTIQSSGVSVIIPTLNAGNQIQRLIDSLQSQALTPLEIIVIDSSSGDDTVEIAREAGCRVERIPQGSFQHGGTRNLGAQLAAGEILVFLTQDALPANADFLAQLIQPVIEGQAEAATARQIPYPDASPLEAYARMKNYPTESFIRGAEDIESLGVMAYFFSNAASAIDRKTFEQLGGFSEDVIVNEDMLFCTRLLHGGYRVAYQSDAVVYHSHNYGLREHFLRYFDIGVFFDQASGELSGGEPGGRGLRFALGQIGYLLKTGAPHWIPRSLTESLLKYLGFRLGKRADKLPLGFKRACSRQPSYWESIQS